MPARVWLRSMAWVVAAAAWAAPVTLRLAVPGPLDVNVVRSAAAVAFAVLFLAWHRGERGFLPSFWPALGLGVAGAYGPILLLGWLLLPAPGVYEAPDGRPGLEILEIHPDGRRLTFGAGQAAREVDVEDDWDGTLGSSAAAEDEWLICFHCSLFTVSRRWPFSDALVLVQDVPTPFTVRYVRVPGADAPPGMGRASPVTPSSGSD